MRASLIKILWWKELRNTFRDKRTFWLTILMPLLMPVVFMLVVPLMMAAFVGKSKPDLMTIAVQGKLGALEAELMGPANMLVLTGIKPVKIEAVADAKLAVESKKYVTAIRMPNALPTDFDQAAIDLEIYSDSSKTRAKTADLYVRAAVDRYNKKLLASKLSALGVQDTNRDVLRIKAIDTADKKSSMSMVALSFILPMLMLAWAMAGAQPAAIDASAAERERGTFETLLVSAVTRAEVLLGKYLSVLSISITSALVGLLGFLMLFAAAKQMLRSQIGDIASTVIDQMIGKISFDAPMLLALAVSAIAISMAISAFALLPSLFARTYKEAQMYLVPSLLLAMALAVPAFAADFFNLGARVAWIPVSGAVASMMRDLAGTTDWWLTAVGFVSSLLFTLIALWVMRKLLSQERVIFRE
jgi:sodium transport system permease protein